MDENFQILLSALIDEDKLSNQLKNLKDLSVNVDKITLNNKAIGELKSVLKDNDISLNLDLGKNTSALQKQASQLGNMAGQRIQDGLNEAIQKGNLKAFGKDAKNLLNFSFGGDILQNNVAQKALETFREISDGVVTVKENMKNMNDASLLNGFTINVRNAKGEVESLNYALRQIKDKNGKVTGTGKVFDYTGGTINAKEAIKQVEQAEKIRTDYLNKLNDLKTKYSNTDLSYGGFEKTLEDFRSGIVTVNELKIAFNELQNSAKSGVQNLKSQQSSFDPIQQALNNMRDMPSKLSTLETSMSQIKDKTTLAGISIEDMTNKYNTLQSEMNQNGGKVPLADSWTESYRELMSTVTSAATQVEALRKAEAADNSQATKQANYYSTIMSNYRQIYDLKKRSLTASEEETKVIKEQMRSLSASNAANYRQINAQGLKDTDLQARVVALKKELEYTLKMAEAHKSDIFNTSKNREIDNLATLKTKWEENGILAGEFKDKVEQLESSLGSVGNKGELDNLKSQIEALKTEAAQMSQSNNTVFKIDTGTYDAKVQKLIKQAGQWTDANGNARISTDELSKSLNQLKLAENNLNANDTVANRKALIEAETQLDTVIKKTTNDINQRTNTYAKSNQIDALRQKYQDFYDKNTAAHGRWGKTVQSGITELSSGAQIALQRYNELSKGIITIQTQARQAGKLGLSFFDTIKQGVQKFSYWTSSTFIVMKAIQEVKEAVSFAKELDSALTNINYTMNVTSSELTDIGNSSIDMAKDLKTSATNVLEAVTLYANAKETADSILQKSQTAIMLSNVTGMSGSESAKMLQSIMNQFDLTQDDLEYISDTVQSVSQNMAYDFSSGIEEIASGIERSGSVAKSAGLDLAEYASMLGLVIEKTGQSGDTVGNAYKTIFQRITKASKTEGTLDEDISNAEESLRAVGVEVRDTADEFRDLSDIMTDLGRIWDTLTPVQQSNISYNVAGIRQTNILKTLLTYWEDYEALVDKTGDSAGTTLENQAKYEETLEAKTAKLSTTMQSFWHNLIGADETSGAISALQTIANILEKISKIGSLPTIGLGLGAFLGAKNVGIFRTFENDLDGVSNKLGFSKRTFAEWGNQVSTSIKQSQGFFNKFKNGFKTAFTVNGTSGQNSLFSEKDIAALKAYNAELDKGTVPALARYRTVQQSGSQAAIDATRAANGQKVALEGVEEGANAASIGMKALSIAGNMLLSMGISLAIQGLITGIDYLIHRNEKLIESANEVTEAYQEQSKTLNDNIKSLQDQEDEFNRLSKGVDDYGKNISLSSDEYDRYKSIVAEILGYSPKLIAGYDEEGNAIAKKNGLLEESISLMKEQQRQDLEDVTTDDNTKTLYKGAKAEYNEQKNERGKLRIGNGRGNSAVSGSTTVNDMAFHRFQDEIGSITGEQYDSATMDWDEYLKKYKDVIKKNYDKIRDFMSEEFITYGTGTVAGYSLSDEDLDSFTAWLKETYDSLDGLEEASHGMDDQFNRYAQLADGYNELSDAQKNFVTDYINATGSIVDEKTGDFLSNDEILKKGKDYKNFVDDLATDPAFDEARDKINSLYALDEKTTPVGEYEKQVNAALEWLTENIKGFNEDDAHNLKIRLGFEFLSDGTTTTDELKKQVQEKLQDEYDDKVGELTLEDLKIATNLEIPEGTLLSWDELLDKIKQVKEEAAKKADTFDLDSFNESIDNIQSAYNTLVKARDEYNENGAYSLDTIQALLALEPQYLAMLVDENGQITLNEEAMRNLVEAQLEEAKAKIYQNGINQINALTEEKAGEAAEGSSEQKANAVKGIDAETDAYDRNSEAILRNVALEASKGKDAVTQEEIQKIVDETIQQANALQSAIDGMSIDFGGVVSGFDSSSSSADKAADSADKAADSAEDMADKIEDANKKIADTEEELEELAKSEALSAIKYKFDELDQSIEKVTNAISLLDDTLGLTSENDYIAKLDITNRQITLAQQKSAMLKDEFEQLRNEEYNSADSANELASRMKSVTDSIAENSKKLIEYNKNIAKYYTSALTSITSLSKSTIDEATDVIDRNIKNMSEGGLMGFSFNLTPNIPQSAYEAQVQQNQSLEDEMQSYYDTVAEMQKTALDLEYQETVASNEKKRQELLDTLNEAKETLEGYSSDVQTMQKTTNQKTSAVQKQDDAEKETETKGFTDTEKGIITDLNDWMTQNPITAPSLDTTSWENLVTQTQQYADRIKSIASSATTASGSTGVADSGNYGEGRDALIKAARSKIGYTEGENNYNIFSAYGNGRWATSDSQAWCNDFVSWAADVAGLSNSIPLGSGVIATAKAFKDKGNLKSASTYTPKVGDIAYYGSGPTIDSLGHIEIVTAVNADGTVTTIGGNTGNGEVAERVRSDKPRFYGTYAKGTKSFKNIDGIAGENNKPEILIDKKTGKATFIDSPTPIDTSKVDVVGEQDTKRISSAKYANGTLEDYTSIDLGSLDIVNGVPKLTVDEIRYLLETKFSNSSVVKASDAEGIYNAQNSSGISALVILGVGALESGWGSKPIGNNIWGYGATNDDPTGNAHRYSEMSQGASEFASEFLKDYYNGYGLRTINTIGSGNGNGNIAYAQEPPGTASTTWAPDISSIMSKMVKALVEEGKTAIESGGYYSSGNSGSLSGSSSSAEEVHVYVDFPTKLSDAIIAANTPSNKEQYEDNLLAYIQKNIDLKDANTEQLLSSFEALQEYQKHGEEQFDEYEQQILQAVGTDKFDLITDQISDAATDYITAIQKASVDATVEDIRASFEQSKDILDKILDYYNERKDADATADELDTIRQAYSSQYETMEELSDQYVSTLSTYTDFLVSLAEREVKNYSDRISWQEKINEGLERQLEETDDISEKSVAIGRLINGYNDEITLYEAQQKSAHNAVLDLYDNEAYKPIFDEFDLESWFDATGEATAKFEDDVARMSINQSELVPMMNELFSLIQTEKKSWYDAEDAIRSLKDEIKDLTSQEQDTQISTWEDYLSKMADLYTFMYDRQQGIIDGLEQEYELRQEIRETLSDATNELRANKDLAEWLDSDTRALLFNEDDYSEYEKRLKAIESSMEDDYDRYQQELSKLDKNDWYEEERLTALYNQRIEEHKEELELARQDLDIAKKQAEYDNRAKERDTQIILGNRTVNVADPEELYDIALEKAQLESEYENTKLTQSENQTIRDMQAENDKTKEQAAALQNNIDMWNDMTDEQKLAMSKFLPTIDVLNAAINSLSTTSIPKIASDISDLAVDAFKGLIESAYSIGLGTNISVDYSALLAQLDDDLAANIITQEQYDTISEGLLMGRAQKQAYDEDFETFEYVEGQPRYNKDFATNYSKRMQNYKARQEENEVYADIQSRIDEIVSKSLGRERTDSENEQLRYLESLRNSKIYNEGLNYAQTSEYGGTIYGNNDIQEKIDNIIADASGRDFTDEELKLLQDLETARNKKIYDEGLNYLQTSKYGGEIFGDNNIQEKIDNIVAGSADRERTDEENELLRKLETARNQKIFSNGLDYEQTSDYGGTVYGDENSDIQGQIDEIIADIVNGIRTEEENNLLRKLETMRNEKIFVNGLDYEQTSEYGAEILGGENSDILGQINSIVANASGRELTDEENTLLRKLETARNQKIFANGLDYEQTSNYGGEIFSDVASAIDTDKYTLLNPEEMTLTTDQTTAFFQMDGGKGSEIIQGILSDAATTSAEELIRQGQAVTMNTGGQDNSITYSIGQITITNPVASADDIISDLTQKASSWASITKNQH